MKVVPFFLLFVLLLATLYTFSQSFAPIGAEWHYNKGNGNVPPFSEYYHYKVTKDTIYAGMSARKIEREHFRYAGDSVQLEPFYIYDRNDSVFYYNEQHQKYLILYDFTVNVGDTLAFTTPDTGGVDSTFIEVVDSISFVSVNGKSLKKVHSSTIIGNYSYFGGYTQYYGSELLLLPQWGLIPYLFGPIRCYRDSSIFIKFSTEDCDHRLTVSSLEENTLSEHIQIHPNPASAFLEIQNPDIQILKIELLDLQGKLIKEYSTDLLKLDLRNIENGTYFLQFTTRNQERITKKLMVQH